MKSQLKVARPCRMPGFSQAGGLLLPFRRLTEAGRLRLACLPLLENELDLAVSSAEKCSEYRREITGKSGGLPRNHGEGQKQQNPLRERVLLSFQFVSQSAWED